MTPLTCARCGDELAEDGGDEIKDALCYACVTMADVQGLFRALDAAEAWQACDEHAEGN